MPPERLVLQVAEGDVPPTELPRSGVLTIGCSAERAGFVLPGDDVADVHCAIGRVKGGGWALKDLGASAGTLVNGARVQSVRLSPGDEIQIGARRLRVVDPESRAAEPARDGGPAASARAAARRARRAARDVAPLPSLTGYRVERALGRGSMGRVYLAVQESLNRPVALKVLPPRLARDADFVRRFQAEARAAAAMNHHNVVTVYDVGADGGLHFLSMEYMARGSLESRVTEVGRLPWRDVLGVLLDAARGLEYAEARGIVHRDIKPANLMQTEDGVTKIADLGLATQLEAEATETMGSKVFGTPHFIAPEQARGEAVDGRTDLYSLGASAFQMLTGRTVFQGDSTREILRAHFFDAPPSVRAEVPEVPDELARLVAQMLAKDPAERPASASAVVAALEALRARERGEAERSGGLKLVAGLLLLLAAGGGAAWYVLGPGASDPREPAAAPGPGERGGAHARGPAGPDDETLAGAPDGGGGVAADPTDSTAEARPPADDDRALKLLELEAKLSVSELPADLGLADRRDALLAIAAEYPGTTEATRIREEVRELEARIASLENAVDERAVAFAGVLTALRGAYQDAPPRAGLEALLAVPGQETVEAYPEFQAERSALVARALDDLRARTRAALDAAADAARAGAFEAVRAGLQRAVDDLAPIDWSGRVALAEEHGAALEELTELRREARRRLALVDHERARFLALRAARDAERLAGELAGPDGLEGELARLELDGAVRRLRGLAESLEDDVARAWAAARADEIARARDALALLGPALAAGEWRRLSIVDPTSRRRASAYEAVSVDAQGVHVLEDGGRLTFEWTEFGSDAKAVDQLFFARLGRDYTPEELRGIAVLVRNAAVLQFTRGVAKVLRTGAFLQFGDDDHDALLAPFEVAAAWAGAAGEPEPLERERRAARALAGALRLAGRDAWSSTAAAIEDLLRRSPDSLVVRLLSDGGGLAPEPPPEPAPPALADEGLALVPPAAEVPPAAAADGPPKDEAAEAAGDDDGGDDALSADGDPDSPEEELGNGEGTR